MKTKNLVAAVLIAASFSTAAHAASMDKADPTATELSGTIAKEVRELKDLAKRYEKSKDAAQAQAIAREFKAKKDKLSGDLQSLAHWTEIAGPGNFLRPNGVHMFWTDYFDSLEEKPADAQCPKDR